jgi:hypothetical protein
MKTMRVGGFLAVTIVAGLLPTPFAIAAQKDEQAEALQAVDRMRPKGPVPSVHMAANNVRRGL